MSGLHDVPAGVFDLVVMGPAGASGNRRRGHTRYEPVENR